VTGAERVTELWGKYDIGDAAQYGVQRLRAKRVVPVARFAFHVVQWVFVRAELASAHEMTKLLGRDTVVPVQVRIFTGDAFTFEAPDVAGMASAGTARTAASVRGRAIRARRDMMTSFLVIDCLLGTGSRVADPRRDSGGRHAARHRETPGVQAKLKVFSVESWV